jgi:ribosomal protein L2
MIISNNCLGVFGQTSNKNYKLSIIKKAGYCYALGKRPIVRGVAMNPCDHPHGGGEGKKKPTFCSKKSMRMINKRNFFKKKII